MILAAVWGTIVYQIVDSVQDVDKDENSETSRGQIPGTRTRPKLFKYVDDVRDPFQFLPAQKESSRRIAPVTERVVWTPPPFRLTGIVNAGRKRTAMFEDVNGSTFILREGDTLRGMKILSIDSKTVKYFYAKKKAEWSMDGI